MRRKEDGESRGGGRGMRGLQRKNTDGWAEKHHAGDEPLLSQDIKSDQVTAMELLENGI